MQESIIKIDELVLRAKELEMEALAITDNNALYGAIPFILECQKFFLKPIIGCKINVATSKNIHKLILLAKNLDGYNNLLKITTFLNSNSALQKNILEKYSKDLIAIGSFGGDFSLIEKYASLFQDNFYIELQKHFLEEEELLNKNLLAFSKDAKIPLVATNNVRFLTKEDAFFFNVLEVLTKKSCLGNLKNIEHFYLKSKQEMFALFKETEEALFNTVAIAAKCKSYFPMYKDVLPSFGKDKNEILRRLVLKGALKRYGSITKELEERLNYELKVIEEMGFVDYFLILFDLVKFLKKNNIPKGPGRGSACSSVVCFALFITDIDPLKYKLIFERFLNPRRSNLPDIDIDVSAEKRDLVLNYLEKKYGKYCVAQIISFSNYKGKSALKDVGKALCLDEKKMTFALKAIEERTLKEALANLQKSSSFKDEFLEKVFLCASKFEGLKKNISVHAAGVVVSKEPLYNLVPLKKGNKLPLTQFCMSSLAKVGFLKFDILALRNLDVIAKTAVSLGKDYYTLLAEFDDLKLTDKNVYKLLSQGQTLGVFQLESKGIRELLYKVKPRAFKDLVAVISLYRPSAMWQIEAFLKLRNCKEEISFLHEDLKEILEETSGLLLYQEQVIKIVCKFAGFSLSKADALRQAMLKGKEELLKDFKEEFFKGCLAKGFTKEVACKLYALLEKFSAYGFNKSHAVAYAFLAFITAYLKVYFPLDYFAALLTSVIGTLKFNDYLLEAKKVQINLLPPDINKSYPHFVAEKEGIRYGLLAVKYLSVKTIEDIISNREKRPFHSLQDFLARVRITNLAFLELKKLGAFRNLSLENDYGIFKDIFAKITNGLLLEIANSSDTALLKKLKEIFKKYKGDKPVFLFYKDKKKVIALPFPKYGLSFTPSCLASLEVCLGKGSVIKID